MTTNSQNGLLVLDNIISLTLIIPSDGGALIMQETRSKNTCQPIQFDSRAEDLILPIEFKVPFTGRIIFQSPTNKELGAIYQVLKNC